MIFILFLSLFISCQAMEETKLFPFLNLPPDLQNLVLSFVDTEYIHWESNKKFKQKTKETLRLIPESSNGNLLARVSYCYKDWTYGITVINKKANKSTVLKIAAKDTQFQSVCLIFNMQCTQIGARIDNQVTAYTLDNNPRMKFLKLLCKNPEKQITEVKNQ